MKTALAWMAALGPMVLGFGVILVDLVLRRWCRKSWTDEQKRLQEWRMQRFSGSERGEMDAMERRVLRRLMLEDGVPEDDWRMIRLSRHQEERAEQAEILREELARRRRIGLPPSETELCGLSDSVRHDTAA